MAGPSVRRPTSLRQVTDEGGVFRRRSGGGRAKRWLDQRLNFARCWRRALVEYNFVGP